MTTIQDESMDSQNQSMFLQISYTILTTLIYCNRGGSVHKGFTAQALRTVKGVSSQLCEKSIFQSDNDMAIKPDFVSTNGVQRNFVKSQ